MIFEIVIERDVKGFHGYCPDLKGLHTCGDTEDEVAENAQNAVLAYIGSLKKHGELDDVGSMVLHVALEKEDRYYVANCEELGVPSFGEDISEAITNCIDATEEYLDTVV